MSTWLPCTECGDATQESLCDDCKTTIRGAVITVQRTVVVADEPDFEIVTPIRHQAAE